MPSTKETELWDTIIIGGGIAGLTASIYLARAGKKVLVLERSAQLGGRASTTVKHACYFNLGPHALYLRGEGMKILQELGIQPRGSKPPSKGWLIDENDRYTLPLGISSLLRNKQFSWQAKAEFMKFYMNLPKIDLAELRHTTFRQWVDQHFQHTTIKTFLFTLARLTTYYDDPDLVSADAVLLQIQLRDVLYLDHGWQSLIEALHDKAIQAQVEIRNSAIVKEISGQYPNMHLTLSTGSKLQARSVLSTASPKDTLNMINDTTIANKIRDLNHSIPAKAACLDIALDGLPDANMVYALDLNQPLYYSVHSASAVLSDNQNYQVIHVMKYLNSPSKISADETLQELKSSLTRLQPGWEKRVIYERFLPEMVVTHGIPTADRGGLSSRPSPVVKDLPGLFIAGDWVGSQGMLADAAFSSAKAATHAIIEAR